MAERFRDETTLINQIPDPDNAGVGRAYDAPIHIAPLYYYRKSFIFI
jgi:hypothetical protein